MNADIKAVGSASAAAPVSPLASDALTRSSTSASSAQKDSSTTASPVKETQASQPAAAPAPKVVAVESGGVLQFSVEPETSQLIIKIVDGNTSEVIRKIPTDQVEEIVSQVRGVSGLIVNKTS